MKSELKTVATKVTPHCHELLERICAKRNVSIYNLLSMFIDIIIRYMDDRHNLSTEIERAITLFDDFPLKRKMLCIADSMDSLEAITAVYILGSRSRQGQKAVLVERDAFDRLTEDWNTSHIIDKVMNVCCPSLYKKLRIKAIALHVDTVFAVIEYNMHIAETEDDLTALRDEFEDCRRTDFGQTPADPVVKSKRIRKRMYVDSRFTKDLFD